MNKTISVNPELFMLSSNRKSSKKRDKKEKQEGEIQVKSPQKERLKTMRKQHIVKSNELLFPKRIFGGGTIVIT